MRYKRPESVLVVLYDQYQRVLIMQREDDPDFWQSVTGTLEPDELPRQTAYREVAEETGINLKALGLTLSEQLAQNEYIIRPQWRHRYPPNTLRNTEYVFAVQIPANISITLTEHLAYRWVSVEEASQIVWSETNRNAILDFVGVAE